METISVSEAVEQVRKNLDELDPNGSIMYQDENGSAAEYGDNQSLDGIIAHILPEAINEVNLIAPVFLLEGSSLLSDQYASGPSVSNDGVLSFALKDVVEYRRLVAFRAADSNVVVSDTIAEASPEGRKQLNPHIRGRKDRPRLVLQQGHGGPAFKYYSLDPDGAGFSGYQGAPLTAIAEMVVIRAEFYIEPTENNPDPEYNVCRRLWQNVIDYTTARVMETFGDQRAQSYYNKANSFPSI